MAEGKESLKLEIKTVKIDSLIEYARNPRKNDDVVDKMVSCINEFGFRIPIVAKSDGTVIDGHLRLKAARKLNLEEVPVVIADDLTDAQIKAFRLVANQSANWAEWDEELLKLELEDLREADFNLELTGFDLKEIEEYLRGDEEIRDDGFDTEEASSETELITKPGDLWLLGKHRVLCGDSTRLDNVQWLMNGQIADMVFTDPPYNVKVADISGFGRTHHEEFAMASGEMSEEEFIEFLTKIFNNLIAVSKDGSIHYVCMDWRHIYEITVAGRNTYPELKQLCVWNKGIGGMGTFYRSQHELIFVFKNGTAKHINNFGLGETGRYRTNVWDYSGMNSFSSENRDELLTMHPTVKPLQMVADAILDCSNYGNLVLDLFGGSGTTLIACEKTNRKCNMMEFSPKYVDTIIRRWEKLTGQEAVNAVTGKTFKEMTDNVMEAL